MKIGIIMAMLPEAKPVIDRYNMIEFEFKPPIKIYRNESWDILLGINGHDNVYNVDNVGTQAATLNAYVMINDMKPDIVINAGTAGGFISQGGEIGDVYIGSKHFVYHDRRIALEGFEDFGHGYYPAIDTDEISSALGLKQGVVTTGNSLDHTPTDMEIIRKHNASCKDMEAAAMAWVCGLYNVPFISLKSITDIVDGDTKVEVDFVKNFHVAVTNLEDKLFNLIAYLRENGLPKG